MAVAKKDDWLSKIVDQRGPLSAKLRVNEDISQLGIKPPGIVLPPNFRIDKSREPRPIFVQREAPFPPKEPLAALRRRHDGASRLHFEKKTNADAGKPKYPVFMEIVDHDANDEFEDYVSQDLLAQFLASGAFSNTILVVIFATSVMVGISTSDELTKQGQLIFDVLDRIFLTVFTLEIALKWGYGFFAFWRVGWNIFDFLLVFVSLMGELLGSQLAFLSSGRILRIFRVLRAFRTLRSIAAMKSLQVIVETILEALPDMANVVLLLLIVYFIFAVISIDSFGEPPEMRPYWGTLENSFYTLFSAMTQDGWEVTYWATVQAGYFLPISVYYVAWIIGSAYIGVNILVGVLVTNLQIASKAQAKEDKAQRSLVARDNGAARPDDSRKVKEVVDIDLLKPEAWRHQQALHMPDFSKVTPAALENYFLVLMAMEDNLAEYKKCKEQIRKVVEVVRAANREESESESDYSDISDDHSLPDEPQGGAGDVMSRMLAMDRDRDKRERERKAAETRKRRENLLRDLAEEVPEGPTPAEGGGDAEAAAGAGERRGVFKKIGRTMTMNQEVTAGLGPNRRTSAQAAPTGALNKIGTAMRSLAPNRRTSQQSPEPEPHAGPVAAHPFSAAAVGLESSRTGTPGEGSLEGTRHSGEQGGGTLRRLAAASAAVHAGRADAEVAAALRGGHGSSGPASPADSIRRFSQPPSSGNLGGTGLRSRPAAGAGDALAAARDSPSYPRPNVRRSLA